MPKCSWKASSRLCHAARISCSVSTGPPVKIGVAESGPRAKSPFSSPRRLPSGRLSDDAHRAVRAVRRHEDDRPAEIRVAERDRMGEQERSGERLGGLSRPLPHGIACVHQSFWIFTPASDINFSTSGSLW